MAAAFIPLNCTWRREGLKPVLNINAAGATESFLSLGRHNFIVGGFTAILKLKFTENYGF